MNKVELSITIGGMTLFHTMTHEDAMELAAHIELAACSEAEPKYVLPIASGQIRVVSRDDVTDNGTGAIDSRGAPIPTRS